MVPLTTIRPDLLVFSEAQIQALMPYFWVLGGSILAIIFSVLKFIRPSRSVFFLSVLTLVIGFATTLPFLGWDSVTIFNRMMVVDGYTSFFNLLFIGCALVTVLVSYRYLDNEDLQHPEYYLLLLFSTIGMMLMVSAQDLVVIFIALEIMSLAVYTLVGFRRSDRKSNEASMKYFVLGGAASAIFLYGAALLYGLTASTNIQDVLYYVEVNGSQGSPLYTIAIWLIFTGFLFKVASVPFHMWMPDVYEGAPSPITGFMTTGLKAASFGTFIRVVVAFGYGNGFVEAVQNHLHDVLWVLAVLTMLIGNVIALCQTHLKRMLAYSSVAHTGYILVGLIAGPDSEQGYAPLLLYLVSYSIMNLGAFIVISLMARKGDRNLMLQDLSGIAKRHPWLSFCFAVFMFSMAGIPPTAGFVAKYLLFYSAIQAGEVVLVVVSVLCSAVSVYYYLRTLIYMYMHEPTGGEEEIQVSPWAGVALASMVFLTIQVGVLPSPLIEIAQKAVTNL